MKKYYYRFMLLFLVSIFIFVQLFSDFSQINSNVAFAAASDTAGLDMSVNSRPKSLGFDKDGYLYFDSQGNQAQPGGNYARSSRVLGHVSYGGGGPSVLGSAGSDFSRDNPRIRTRADFVKFRELVGSGTDFAGVTVTLEKDVDLGCAMPRCYVRLLDDGSYSVLFETGPQCTR